VRLTFTVSGRRASNESHWSAALWGSATNAGTHTVDPSEEGILSTILLAKQL